MVWRLTSKKQDNVIKNNKDKRKHWQLKLLFVCLWCWQVSQNFTQQSNTLSYFSMWRVITWSVVWLTGSKCNSNIEISLMQQVFKMYLFWSGGFALCCPYSLYIKKWLPLIWLPISQNGCQCQPLLSSPLTSSWALVNCDGHFSLFHRLNTQLIKQE